MSVKEIKVTNFKNFGDIEARFGKFNVVIGANASGKSNFVQIFQFLRDIVKAGLDNAVSMQGGVEYLRNINIGASQDFALKVVSDQEFRFVTRKNGDSIGIKTYEIAYELALKFKRQGSGYEIGKDNLTQKCTFIRLQKQNGRMQEKEELGKGEITIRRVNGKAEVVLHKPDKVPLEKDDIYPPFLKEQKLPPKTLLLQILFLFVTPFEPIFSGISIYDFDPKLPKKATPIIGKAELEEDGSNLSIILKDITGNKNKSRKLFNLVKDLLPFIGRLEVEKFADKSLLFKLQEKYFRGRYLPASLISDGTINITALLVALYFEEKPLTIIEEPERNIHPYLISRVVDMMKDASEKKQVMVTTHHPEIVKYAGLDHILLLSRDEEGFSTVTKPGDKEGVKTFLENEMGVGELYVQNLLGV